jgi:GNAT superfamily N-acetyltransferase
MTIKIVPVTKANVEQAIALACQVFKPGDHASIRDEFRAAVGLEPENSNVRNSRQIYRSGYVMALKDGVPAGFSGYYSQVGHEEDAWLGWTGVLKSYRCAGIGEAVVKAALKAAPSCGVKNLRIWTTDEDQYANARRLYLRMGYQEEIYAPAAKAHEGRSLARVFSKAANPSRDPGTAWERVAYRLPDLELGDLPRLNKVAKARVRTTQRRDVA